MVELRNQYGTWHWFGQVANSKRLSSRHAKLVVGAASTIAVFLLGTYEIRNGKKTEFLLSSVNTNYYIY